MANPRVFVSSTCYDLAEVRDSLTEFVSSFGFDPVLSERGDIFYHPDLHTQDSCIKEISNCNLFILIIGGRFGGAYSADTKRSIVNAEFGAAKELKIPVFTFVKQEVADDHRVYLSNRENATSIVFPSMENQDFAINIFDFIDEVRRSSVNDGYFPFKYSNEIKEILRKQWAGMFYDFLAQRSDRQLAERTQTALSSITAINEKIEEITKGILRSVNSTEAESLIVTIDKENSAKQFFSAVRTRFGTGGLMVDGSDPVHSIDLHDYWFHYLCEFFSFKIVEDVLVNPKTDKQRTITLLFSGNVGMPILGNLSKKEHQEAERFQELYSGLKELNREVRSRIISENYEELPF